MHSAPATHIRLSSSARCAPYGSFILSEKGSVFPSVEALKGSGLLFLNDAASTEKPGVVSFSAGSSTLAILGCQRRRARSSA